MQGYHYIVVNSSYIDRSITLRNTYALIGQLFLLLIMNTLGFGRNKKKCNTKYYITLPHIDKIRYIFFLIRNNLNEKEEGKIIYVKFFLSLKKGMIFYIMHRYTKIWFMVWHRGFVTPCVTFILYPVYAPGISSVVSFPPFIERSITARSINPRTI